MRAIFPGDRLPLDQTHVRFVHKNRGLKGVSLALAGQTAQGDAMQFSMYERDDLLESSLVATLPPLKKRRYRRTGVRNAAILVHSGPCFPWLLGGKC